MMKGSGHGRQAETFAKRVTLASLNACGWIYVVFYEGGSGVALQVPLFMAISQAISEKLEWHFKLCS